MTAPDISTTGSVNEQPFFVVGCPRSGTTLLRVILDEHPRLAIPQESWFVVDLMDALPRTSPLTKGQVEEAFELIARHHRWAAWGISDPDLKDALERLDGPALGELIAAVFELHASRRGKPRCIEPDVRWYIQEYLSPAMDKVIAGIPTGLEDLEVPDQLPEDIN